MLNDDINRFLGVFAYPFSDPEFVYKDPLKDYYTQYNKKCSSQSADPVVKDKSELRHDLINYMNRLYTIYSYDEIYLYLEKWYLYPQKPSIKENVKHKDKEVFNVIFHNLRLLCQSFISQRDGKFVYKYWENECDKKILGGFSGENKIYLFHSFNRLIPIDILIILFMLENQKNINDLNNYYGYIEISDMLLDNVLHKGVAENHLHSGVSCSFISLWNEITQLTVSNEIKDKIKNLNFISPINNKSQNIVYLCLASNLKLIISFLLLATNDSQIENVTEKVNKYKKMLYTKPCTDNSDIIDEIIDKYEETHNDFLSLIPSEIHNYKELFKDTQKIKTQYENIFLYKVLEYIKREQGKDRDELRTVKMNMIKKMFLDYLRIKNYFYQLVVQRKNIHGLDYFQMFYNNNSGFKIEQTDKKNNWKKRIGEQLQNDNLKKLELRTSISYNDKKKNIDYKKQRTYKDIKAFMTAYYEILRDNYCCQNKTTGEYELFRPFPKVGLVFHLLKREQESYPEKCTNKYEVYSYDAYIQYGKIYKQYNDCIEHLTTILKDSPILSYYVLGIDVASLENAVPTWVYVDAFEKARDASKECILKDGKHVQSLCFTFHAGEDFRHIFSGIRRIYEVVSFLKFHAGDRIGHGIALGISPELWYRNNSTVLIPRVEALENYVWAYYMLVNNAVDDNQINIHYIENKIYELAEEIYVITDETENKSFTLTSYITPQLLVNVYKKLFSHGFMKECFAGFKWCNDCDTDKCYFSGLMKQDQNRAQIDLVTCFANSFHCKLFVHKMNEPINMKVTEQDIRIACELQKMTADVVNRKGIIVEVNPSSNVVISDTDTLGASHLFSINSDEYNFNSTIVCINSDDPSVFNTNVSNEIGYIYFSMLEKGKSREKILSWIDKIRENGMNASFIRDSMSDIEILHDLETFVNDH